MHTPDDTDELDALIRVYTSKLQTAQHTLQTLLDEHTRTQTDLRNQHPQTQRALQDLERFQKRPQRGLSARAYLEEEEHERTLEHTAHNHRTRTARLEHDLKSIESRIQDARTSLLRLQNQIDALQETLQTTRTEHTRRRNLAHQDDLDERFASQSQSRRRVKRAQHTLSPSPHKPK